MKRDDDRREKQDFYITFEVTGYYHLLPPSPLSVAAVHRTRGGGGVASWRMESSDVVHGSTD